MAINREAIVASAEKLVARGKIDGAIKEYRKLVADNPGDAMTINRLGDLYVRINRNEEAVKLFLQIADRYTDDGFFVKGIAIFKKIIKLDPTRLPVYERLAELYHKQGLVTEARTQYQVLVDYYLKHAKIESAEIVLRKMTALDSGDPTPHVKLAEIFRDRGEHDKELHEYRLLAEMMLRHKRVDEAAQVYAKAIAAAPNDLGFITDAVLGLKDAGHPAAAAKLLALAVEKNPQAEKIARIAGIGERKKFDTTGVRMVESDGQRVLKVSDIAPAPPEFRSVPPPRPESPRADSILGAAPRPDFLLEEIELDFPGGDRAAAQGHFGQVAEAPAKAPAEPWLPLGASDDELEFVLEIEGEEDEAVLPARAASSAPPAAAAATPPPASTGQLLSDIDWAFEPEPSLDLDLPVAPPAVAASPPIMPPIVPSIEAAVPPLTHEPPKPRLPSPVAPQPDMSARLEELERAATAVPPSRPAPKPEVKQIPAARSLADLLAEAEVFRKHGLSEKAHDRLRSILTEEPKHAGALGLAVLLLLEEGKPERALARAQQLERLAPESSSAAEAWDALRPKLEKAGFRFESGALSAAPEPKKAKRDSVSLLLDELAGLSPKKAPVELKKTTPKGQADLAALVEGLAATARIVPAQPAMPSKSPRPPALPKPAPPAAAPPPAIAASVETEPAQPATPALPVFDAEDAAIDDKLSWLDDAAARAAQKPQAAGKSKKTAPVDDLFADEEGFFDLAAELEEELLKEEVGGKESLAREEPTLEEIVEGFKKGVAESLSPEDYDTHFNLGIAYREMGLLDEAIGEFQLAAKHPNYLLDCCTLLGSCFLDKGLPELAVKWFQRGLATPNLTEGANLGLLYDLGNLYVTTGDHDHARRTFAELHGMNSNYRDVVARLEELGSL